MYVHPAFRIENDEALHFLKHRAFGLLVVQTQDAPFGVHLPFLCDQTDQGGLRVAFHVARANPIHECVGDGTKALLAVQGPDAYISPDWYGVADQVPTWTYVAVHLTGQLSKLPPEQNLAHVDRLSAYFEDRLRPKQPWTSEKMDARKRRMMLTAIVSLQLDVESVEAQKKLVQHKGETEHRGAIAGLRQCNDAASHLIADMMEETAKAKFG